MEQIVSITSQGQISIPVNMRRALGLKKYHKASVRLKHNQLIVEPIPDIIDLAGSLNAYAFKNKSAEQIMAREDKVLGEVFNR